MNPINNIEAWRALEYFSKYGSLVNAAKELNVEVSTISRGIASLEKALNRKLIDRTKRPVQITEFGKEILDRFTPVLQSHVRFLELTKEDSPSIEGVIKFSAASGSLSTFLMGWLQRFRELYPELNFHVSNGRQLEECRRGEIDVVSVNGEFNRDGLVVLDRGVPIFVAVASPEYLSKYGEPAHPGDLIEHLGFRYTGPVRPPTRFLEKGQEKQPVAFKSTMESTDIIMIKKALTSGLGIAVDMPLYHCIDLLESGQLKVILPGWHQPSWGAYVACSKEAWHKRRVRLFMEWYANHSTQEFLNLRERLEKILGKEETRKYYP